MTQAYKRYRKASMDGRIKLDPKFYAKIKQKYDDGGYSWKELADEYGVSKGTIGKIVSEKCANSVKNYAKKVWIKYYDKEKHNLKIKKYRDKKRKLGLVCSLKYFNSPRYILQGGIKYLDKNQN